MLPVLEEASFWDTSYTIYITKNYKAHHMPSLTPNSKVVSYLDMIRYSLIDFDTCQHRFNAYVRHFYNTCFVKRNIFKLRWNRFGSIVIWLAIDLNGLVDVSCHRSDNLFPIVTGPPFGLVGLLVGPNCDRTFSVSIYDNGSILTTWRPDTQ